MAEPIKGSYKAFFFDSKGETVLSITSKEIKYSPHKEKVDIGDKLGKVEQDVLIELESCELLKIGNNLVFILPNDIKKKILLLIFIVFLFSAFAF